MGLRRLLPPVRPDAPSAGRLRHRRRQRRPLLLGQPVPGRALRLGTRQPRRCRPSPSRSTSTPATPARFAPPTGRPARPGPCRATAATTPSAPSTTAGTPPATPSTPLPGSSVPTSPRACPGGSTSRRRTAGTPGTSPTTVPRSGGFLDHLADPCTRSADRHLLRRASMGDHHRCDHRVVAAERPRRRRSELGRGRAAFRTPGPRATGPSRAAR